MTLSINFAEDLQSVIGTIRNGDPVVPDEAPVQATVNVDILLDVKMDILLAVRSSPAPWILDFFLVVRLCSVQVSSLWSSSESNVAFLADFRGILGEFYFEYVLRKSTFSGFRTKKLIDRNVI